MEDENCSRYLGSTLLASASTFGLFAAANWGLWLLIGNPFWKLIGDPPCCRGSGMRSFLAHLMLAFAMPFYPFFIALNNVLSVCGMRASLSERRQHPREHDQRGSLDHDSIAIMTTCPIFIKIPDSLVEDDEKLLKSREYRIVYSFHDFIRPSELPPAADPAAVNSAGSAAEAAGPHSASDLPPAAGKGVDSPADSAAAGCKSQVNGAGSAAEAAGSQSASSKGYILLSKPRINDLIEREVLLALGLVPDKEEIQFLRSRRFFLTVVTMLQALGYTLGVLERLVARVAISPVEAILTLLCLLVTLQLLAELYVSGNYQRPLLLSLSHDQFLRFLRFEARSKHNFRCLISGKSVRVNFSEVSESILALLISLIMAAPFLYYALAFHHQSQYLCSLSAFLFFLVPPTTILGSIVFRHINLDDSIQKNVAIHCECLLFILSFVLALVATVKHWELFQKPSRHIFFQWILPHVAT